MKKPYKRKKKNTIEYQQQEPLTEEEIEELQEIDRKLKKEYYEYLVSIRDDIFGL